MTKLFPFFITQPVFTTLTSVVISLVAISCHNVSPTIDPDNEEATYLLVGEPCSEGRYDLAIKRADSLLSSGLQMSDTLRTYIMIDRNVALLESGNLDRTADCADSLISFGRKAGIGRAVLEGMQTRGIVSRRRGDYDSAIALYKDGLEEAMSEGDTEMEQTFAEMLAIACGERGLTEEALKFADHSLRLATEAADSMGELNSVATIGAILVKTGQFDEAIKRLAPYRQMSMNERPVMRVKYLTPLVKSYLQLDSVTRAREITDELHSVLEGVSRTSQAYRVVVIAEAEIARLEGRHNDRLHWLELSDSIGAMGVARDIVLSQRAGCLADLGRHAEAYKTLSEAYLALDSASTAETDVRIAELSVSYDNLKKEAEIAVLEARLMKWIIAALACVVLIATGIVVTVASRRRLALKLEREKHRQFVKGIEQERVRIARELHDDIAGALVGLQLQAPDIDRSLLSDALSLTARRVRHISHELMPPEFGHTPLTAMLLDFASRINNSKGDHTVTLTDEGSYDWNSLKPAESLELYRIVQEAVNNAMRHGAPGTIRITLGGGKRFNMTVSNQLMDKSGNQNTSANSSEPTAGLRSMRARAEILDADLITSINHDNNTFTLNITQRP